MLRACRPGLPDSWRRADRGAMPEIPPALEAAMREYARQAVDESPALAEEQVRQLRAALRPEPDET